MEESQALPDSNKGTRSEEIPIVQEVTADFRRDLAFPKFTDEMVQRLRGYGHEEKVASGSTLYTQGDRGTDMFVVLDGGIDIWLRTPDGERKAFASHRRAESQEGL